VGRAWAICHRTSDRRYTARELENTFARNLDVEVTLVNGENFFLFTPMLHEVAASDLNLIAIVNPIRRTLKRANFFEGENDKQ
jgi:NADH dehydrogenase